MSTLTADQKPQTTGVPQVSWQEKLRRWIGGETFTAYLFLAMPLFILFFIKIYPVFYNVFLSFTNYDLFTPLKFVGLKNYQYVF